jgi:hypothetical protein
MVSKRLGIYGFISAAALVSGILTGCAGSSASVSGQGGTVSTTGGISNASGSGPAGGTTASSAPQQVQVNVGGTVETGTLPTGESIPPGGTVCVVPANQPIINGLTLGPKFHGVQTTPASTGTTTVKTAASTGSQGEVDVDGTNTGLTVQPDGSLSGILLLTPGNHTITAWGSLVIVSGTQQLTVGKFNFGVVVGSDGVGSMPSAITMKLPANGGSLSNGSFVTVTYPTPDFATGSGNLAIGYSGITVSKTQLVKNGMTTFNSLNQNHPAIPQGGVDTVTFNYSLSN